MSDTSLFYVHSCWDEWRKRKVFYISTASYPSEYSRCKIQGKDLIFTTPERAYAFLRILHVEDLDTCTYASFTGAQLYS